jgi:hypothetical protein
MIEIHIELQRMSRLMNDASMYIILNMFHMMWKKRWLIYVTIARNWLLHWAHQHNSWYSTLKIENLQVCENCHTSLKFISRIVRRAILVGDVNHFH